MSKGVEYLKLRNSTCDCGKKGQLLGSLLVNVVEKDQVLGQLGAPKHAKVYVSMVCLDCEEYWEVICEKRK